MNKFTLLICLIFIINISNVISIEDYNKLYDILISLAKGMAKTERAVCSSLLVKKRSSLFPVIKEIATKIENGKEISSVTYFFKLYAIVDDCDLYRLSDVIDEIQTEAGIREAGYSIADNAGSIYNIIQEISSSDDFYVEIGKIISIVFNYYVN